MKSFNKISCILIQLEKDNVLRTKRANCCRQESFCNYWEVVRLFF